MRSCLSGIRGKALLREAPAKSLVEIALGVLILFSMTPVCTAEEYDKPPAIGKDLTEMSIEDLMSIEITSVSKKTQRLSDAPAAIFVITSEDIRRSGATTIPDLLRMVPGLEVAQINKNNWAITARGFNGRLATKLLVLMDGRSVYSPIFSGVYWEVQDTLLEDIERIEVIRGPGATIWGANAVNGVINIITKNAKDTQGGFLSVGGGNEEKGFGSIRYGGKAGNDLSYRLYTKYFKKDNGVYTSGEEATDGWQSGRAGFRVDYPKSGTDAFTFQGDIYNGREGETTTLWSLEPPYSSLMDTNTKFKGGNIIGRWTHSSCTVQFYYDKAELNAENIGIKLDTYDFDFLQRLPFGNIQEIVWGFGYRYSQDDITKNTFTTSIIPTSRSYDLANAFVQDEIMLSKDVLRFTIGSKFEHNSFTGFEIQPSTKLMWTPDEYNSVWCAISRAVRTPSRGEDDASFTQRVIPANALQDGSPLTAITFSGNRDFKSEELLAYELGYRVKPLDRFSLDIATFYNDYDKLRTAEPAGQSFVTSPLPPHALILYTAANKMKGYSYGLETAADWKVLDWWHLQPAYTFIKMHLTPYASSQYDLSTQNDDVVPKHQVSLRSSMNLPKNVELDLWYRYVAELSRQDVAAYSTLDARIGWKPLANLELSIVGQSLLKNHHLEFRSELLDTSAVEVERSVYTKVAWQF
jgi:iron complex outermembrane recepter protein